MWQPYKLTLQNFRSFKEETFEFKNGEAYLIQGINRTDEGASSNGSGKSSLREAWCYANDLPTFSDRDVDLINDDENEVNVWAYWKHTSTQQVFKIHRNTPLKGSSKLKLTLGNEDLKDRFATVPEGNKLIFEILGVAKEDMLNYYVISKEKFVSFFGSSDSKKKELISRFSSADRINDVEYFVEQDVVKIQQNIILKSSNLDRAEGKLEALISMQNDLKDKDVESIKKNRIEKYKELIANYFDLISSIKKNTEYVNTEIDLRKKDISKVKEEIIKLKSELDSLIYIDYNKEINNLEEKKQIIKGKIRDTETLETNINYDISDYKEVENEINIALKNSIECPKCLHKFLLDGSIDIAEAEKMLPEVIEKIKNLRDNLKSLNNKIIVFEKSIDKIDVAVKEYGKSYLEYKANSTSLEDRIYDKNNEIKQLSRNIERSELCIKDNIRKIDDSEDLINSYNEKIDGIDELDDDYKEKDIKEGIASTSKEINLKTKEIYRLKVERDNLNVWVFRFAKFKSYLANKSLVIIQGYANKYLQEMKTNLGLKLEGFKENADGSIREKITPKILRNGEVKRSGNFKKCSSGERAKIDFAVILAVQNLINLSAKSGGVDILWTDEEPSGLDSVGLENITESVGNIGKTCLITSHVNHEKNYSNIITIEKVGDVSKII